VNLVLWPLHTEMKKRCAVSGQLTIFESCLQMNNSTERPVQSGCSQKDDLGCEANARGIEALCRWPHRTLASVLPTDTSYERKHRSCKKPAAQCCVIPSSGRIRFPRRLLWGRALRCCLQPEIDVRRHNRNTLPHTPDTRGDEKNAILCLFEGAMCVCCCVIVPIKSADQR
jgi:hypothetical protein